MMREFDGYGIATAALNVFDMSENWWSVQEDHCELYTSVRTVARSRNQATKAALLPLPSTSRVLQYNAKPRITEHVIGTETLRIKEINPTDLVVKNMHGFSKPSVLARDHFHDLARSVCLHCFINLELIPKTKTSSSSERCTGAVYITNSTRG